MGGARVNGRRYVKGVWVTQGLPKEKGGVLSAEPERLE